MGGEYKMRKVVRTIIFSLFLIIFVIGIYWFVIHPSSYKYDTAVKNGDIVMGAGGIQNIDKLYNFINSIENGRTDKIRITAYSKEGYPIIFDLFYESSIIKCTTDNTRNLFGRSFFKIYGEYTTIFKDNNGDYFLTDESSNNENLWIFQE